MLNDFAVFILTHGRAGNITTYNTLYRQGYTGKIYIIVDNEDKSASEYKKRFGDKVIVFDKLAVSKIFDVGDNFTDTRTVVYARNACFDIAKQLGIKYFMQLDDDYSSFVYKYDEALCYKERPIYNLDSVLGALLKFYKQSNATTIAMAQNGDFIGGKKSGWATQVRLHRKAMNTFICSVDRPFKFVGRINEDVNTYVVLGNKGELFLTVPNVAIIQRSTQKAAGGLTDFYLDYGTYLKSMYPVMMSPSCVTVNEMGHKHKRLHHRIAWNNAVPLVMAH